MADFTLSSIFGGDDKDKLDFSQPIELGKITSIFGDAAKDSIAKSTAGVTDLMSTIDEITGGKASMVFGAPRKLNKDKKQTGGTAGASGVIDFSDAGSSLEVLFSNQDQGITAKDLLKLFAVGG